MRDGPTILQLIDVNFSFSLDLFLFAFVTPNLLEDAGINISAFFSV